MTTLYTLRERKFAIGFIFIVAILAHADLHAGQLTLSWSDNSTDETGFKIERATALSGPFTQITTTSANATSYTDSGLADVSNFCYRVRATNSAGDSAYTNVACGTSSAALTVGKTGTGTVTSSPAAINCGSICSGNYAAGTSVALTAAAGTNYTFTGWSGACTGAGSCVVTMDGARSVTATFTTQSYALTLAKAGTGGGTVTSSPSGINCGSTCATNFNAGTSVTLTAAAASGSAFAGWSGACTGTGSCVVSMSSAKSVTATFNIQTFALTVTKSGVGSGTVTSSPAGINCGSTCSSSYNSGTSVTLTATPASGSTFTGWSGACTGTGSCVVSLSSAKSVTATFSIPPPAAPSVLSVL